jgi:NCS1 family nucleobase:cation symporter-1
MTLYSFIGVAILRVGGAVRRSDWDPVALIGRFNQPLVAFIALVRY